jgi:ABC-type glycerol-3-phosphate transport system permease component
MPRVIGSRNIQGQHSTDWNLLMATVSLGTIPTIVVLIAQRWFVRGIAMLDVGDLVSSSSRCKRRLQSWLSAR